MKALFDWIKQSWFGVKLWELWRMFFTDGTGVSMRKVLAVNCFLVADYLIIIYTDKTNLEWAIGQLFVTALALLGIVTYDSIKQKKIENENKVQP